MATNGTSVISPLASAQFAWPDAYSDNANAISVLKEVRITSETGKYFNFTFKADSVRNANEPEKITFSVSNFKGNFDSTTQYIMCFELVIKTPRYIQSIVSNNPSEQIQILNMKTARFYPKENTVTTFVSNPLNPCVPSYLGSKSATVLLNINIHQPCQSYEPSVDQDVQKLCFSEDLSDIKITCGGETFPCHKFILGARSDVFKAMLSDSPMFKERQEGLLTIDDTTAETMKSFLFFLYNDTVPVEEMTCELLILADKYNVKRLVDICSRHNMTNMSVNNVLELLYTSYLINDDRLLEAASKFLVEHRGKIVKGPFWNDMKAKNPGIAAKIIEKIFFKDE